MKRCAWAKTVLSTAYHDLEWGVPQHEDRVLFEFLILEGAQAGLSWETILQKRENYRRAFKGFDPRKVAKFGPEQIERLMLDSGIVRNRLKITAAVINAGAFLKVQAEFGSFDRYIWRFVREVSPDPAEGDARITRNAQSDAMSRDLRQRGFKFVGTTICYAFMQAVGMVNDHEAGCFRRRAAARHSREKAAV